MSQQCLLKECTTTDNAEFEMEVVQDTEIDHKIIMETNKEMGTLSKDLILLKELFQDCAALVFNQGEKVDQIEENITNAVEDVEKGTENLKVAEKYKKHGRGRLFDICVLLGGTGLGALGLLGGPWIGIPTLMAGLGVSGSVIIARNKIKKHI
jgi:hypothetical protein